MANAFWLSAALVAATPISDTDSAESFSEANNRDAECLSVFAHELGNTPKSESQKWTGLVSMVAYYTGKLKGRNADLDLGAILTPELITRVLTNWSPTAERCNKEGAALSQHMIAVGNKLQELGDSLQSTGA